MKNHYESHNPTSYWYAVMMDGEDTDWGTGTYDLAEALALVADWRAHGYPDAYVAVIDEGKDEDGNPGDPICIDEIK